MIILSSLKDKKYITIILLNPTQMTIYEPTLEDIQMMLKQVNIKEAEAKQYLIKCKGNIYNAVCSAMGEEDLMEIDDDEEKIDISENHIDPEQRISQFRNILNKKDKIFMDVTKKEDVSDNIYDIGFVAFKPETKNFSKENTKQTMNSFIELIAKSFIETGKLENMKSYTFEDIKDNPNILGKKKVSEEEMNEIQSGNDKIIEEDKKRKELEQQLFQLENNESQSNDPRINIEVENAENNENNENNNNNENNDNNENINNNENIVENIEAIIEKVKEPHKQQKIDKATESIRKQLAQFIDDKLEIKPLIGKANDMVKKWRCTEAAIIYKHSYIKSADMLGILESKLESQKMNVIATKLMINAEIIKKNQFYTGNALVVDKWLHYSKTI